MIPFFLNSEKKSPLLAFIKFERTFLTGSLAVCLSAPVQGGAGGRGVWGEFRPPRPASSVRIFSNRHRQVLHSAKLKDVASALCAEANSYDFTKSENWRRGRDSNPRRALTLAAFRERYFQPLSHLSKLWNYHITIPIYYFNNNIPFIASKSKINKQIAV